MRKGKNNDALYWTGLDEYKKSLVTAGKRLPKIIERQIKDLAFTAEKMMSKRIGQITSEAATGQTRASITFEIQKSKRAFCISVGPTTKYAGWLDDGTKSRAFGIPIRDRRGNPTSFLLWVAKISGLKVNPNPKTASRGSSGKRIKPKENVTKRFNVNLRKKRTSKAMSRRRKHAKSQGFKWADDLAFVMSRSIAASGTEAKNYIKYTEKEIYKYQARTGKRIIAEVVKQIQKKK